MELNTYDWDTEQFENFIFGPWLFDVQKAKKILAKKKRLHVAQLTLADVRPILPMIGIRHNTIHEMEIDLEFPVLLAWMSRNETQIPIDGWHRIYKALDQGIKELPCVMLSKTDSKHIRRRA